MTPQLDAHYQMVLRALLDGRVVPVLGAGVNGCGRPAGAARDRGRHPPNGAELARHLASCSAYPDPDPGDLVRVSQYFAAMLGAADRAAARGGGRARRDPHHADHTHEPGAPGAAGDRRP